MNIFTKMTTLSLFVTSALSLVGAVLYCISLISSIENANNFEAISILVCEIACIIGCAGIMAGILSFDEN